MPWRSDVNVAGVRVRANHVPELVTRLRRAGEPFVAYKVQQVLGARTLPVTFGPFEREAIVRAVADRPPQFSELYAALLRELPQRRGKRLNNHSQPGSEPGDATPSRRPSRRAPWTPDDGGFLQRVQADAAGARRPGTPRRPKVTVTKDTLLEILRQSLERTRSKPPQPSYQQIADDNNVKRSWVTPIIKWAEDHPEDALDTIRLSEVPARFSTIIRG